MPDQMTHAGFLAWAEAYVSAAETLYFKTDKDRSFSIFAGPLVQMTGLAVELTLKCIARGLGKSEQELRSFGHNTYNSYLVAREAFDEVKFIDLVFSNTAFLAVPLQVGFRMRADEDDVHLRWRVFFDHLRILDETYSAPYRSRYVIPGEVVLPEPFILLVGSKILISAMKERLE